MIALKIEDMKQFTASLFLGEVFDSFLLKEAEIVTFNMFTIDGRVRHGYYSEEELEEHQIEEEKAKQAKYSQMMEQVKERLAQLR